MAPPRRARAPRARPRRGSLERPVNARLVRGTWLLVALPLLLAAFTVGRPQPLPPPTLPPRSTARPRSRSRASWPATIPDRTPGSAGALGAATLGRGAARPLRLPAAGRPLRASVPGLGDVRAAERRRGGARASRSGAIVVMAHRDDTRRGPRRERQRVRHGRADRARARVRPGGGSDRPCRRSRRTRSSSSRPTAARSAASAPPASPSARRTRRRRARGAEPGRRRRARAHRGSIIGGDTPRSPAAALVRTAAVASLEQTGAAPVTLGVPSAARPRLPVHARRAGAVRLGGRSGGDADDAAGRAGRAASSTIRSASSGSASSAAPRRRRSARSTRASSWRRGRRATSISAPGSSAAGRSSSSC